MEKLYTSCPPALLSINTIFAASDHVCSNFLPYGTLLSFGRLHAGILFVEHNLDLQKRWGAVRKRRMLIDLETGVECLQAGRLELFPSPTGTKSLKSFVFPRIQNFSGRKQGALTMEKAALVVIQFLFIRNVFFFACNDCWKHYI